MKNILILFLAISMLVACQSNDQAAGTGADGTPSTAPAQLTEAEQKALLLTGTALSGQATAAMVQDNKALEITLSNSLTLDQEIDLTPLHASRAVWVFYKNRGDDVPSYDKIVVKAILKDTTYAKEYTVAQLATAKARYQTVEVVAQLLVNGDYAGLYELFDKNVMGNSSVDDLASYCTQLEPEYGKPLSFEFRGLSFEKTSTGQDFLSLAGQLKRSIKDTPLNIAIDLKSTDMKGSLNAIKFDY